MFRGRFANSSSRDSIRDRAAFRFTAENRVRLGFGERGASRKSNSEIRLAIAGIEFSNESR